MRPRCRFKSTLRGASACEGGESVRCGALAAYHRPSVLERQDEQHAFAQRMRTAEGGKFPKAGVDLRIELRASCVDPEPLRKLAYARLHGLRRESVVDSAKSDACGGTLLERLRRSRDSPGAGAGRAHITNDQSSR